MCPTAVLAMIVGRGWPTGRSGSSGLETKVVKSPETAAAQRSNPMTGLDLESFLLLLRADLTTWVVLGLATLGLAVLVWSSWRSRRALRNCLVLSFAAHLGLVLYGSTIPAVMWTLGRDRRDAADQAHIRQIRVAPLVESNASIGGPRLSDSGPIRSTTERWDLASAPSSWPTPRSRSHGRKSTMLSKPIVEAEIKLAPLPPVAIAAPKSKEPVATPPESRPEPISKDNSDPPTQPVLLPPVLAEMDQVDAKTPTV